MDSFDPVKYSVEENHFLLENVGLAPIVALNKTPPAGVNPKAVRPVLQEVFDREQLRTQSAIQWAGVEAIKHSILVYIEKDKQWEEDYRRTRGRIPRLPSMHTKDGKGKYHLSGSGSDSSYPQTWEDSDGNRHRFAVDLDGAVEFDDLRDIVKSAPKALIYDTLKNRIECPICNHTESYKSDSKASENVARARMSKHLKSEKFEASLHRELYTNEFGV